eukprot:349718-Prymnesium_polylepis.1
MGIQDASPDGIHDERWVRVQCPPKPVAYVGPRLGVWDGGREECTFLFLGGSIVLVDELRCCDGGHRALGRR